MKDLIKGDHFSCEGHYYIITRGSICSNDMGAWTFFTKSSNLLVQRLDWELKTAEPVAIDDFKNREFFMVDKYILQPVGTPRKFFTMRKEFEITPFNEAIRIVAWKKEKERETHKDNKKYDKKFLKC